MINQHSIDQSIEGWYNHQPIILISQWRWLTCCSPLFPFCFGPVLTCNSGTIRPKMFIFGPVIGNMEAHQMPPFSHFSPLNNDFLGCSPSKVVFSQDCRDLIPIYIVLLIRWLLYSITLSWCNPSFPLPILIKSLRLSIDKWMLLLR